MLAGAYKDLAKIVRIALQLPVTQVSVDSVFSSLKYVLNDLRMRFWVDVVDAILVLRANNYDRTTCVFCMYSLCFTLLLKTYGMILTVCKKVSSHLCKNCPSQFFVF